MNDTPKNLQKALMNSRLIGALLIALVSWVMATSAYRGMIDSGVRGGDFHFFYQAAQRLNAHQHLYVFEDKGQTYVYPPLFALALRPFAGTLDINPGPDGKIAPEAQAQFLHAQKAWFICSAACIFIAAAFFALALRLTAASSASIAIMLLTAFHFWPTVMTFGLGQTNLLCLAALAGMFYADRANKPLLAALCIVACAMVKTWFVGMLLYFILRRMWKPLLQTIALGLIATAILFTLVGWSELATFLALTKNYAAGTGTQVLSQSIAGFAALHFGPPIHIHPLIQSIALAALVKWSGNLLVLAALAFVFFKNRTPATPFDQRLELSLVSLSLLLLLPYSQNEYLVMALPALWGLLLAPAESGLIAFLIAAACYVIFTRPGPYYPENAKAFQDGLRSLATSVPFFALSLLWAITFVTILRRRQTANPIILSDGPVLERQITAGAAHA